MIALTHLPSASAHACELTHVPRQPIDFQRLKAQHEAYRQALSAAGCAVRVFDINSPHADAAFVEDVAVVLDELIILGSMGAKSREPETEAWQPILAELRALQVLPPEAKLEGGDVLRIGKDLLIGHSARTNAAAIEAVSRLVSPMGYTVHVQPICKCLHLKTACTAVDDETLLINPHWIAKQTLPHKKLILAKDEWGANVVRLSDRLLANSQHEATMEQLTKLGHRVESVDLSEFAKAEGGATCLSLLV